jgi:MFS family permease
MTDLPNAAARFDSWTPLVGFFGANLLFGAGLFAHAFLYNFYLDALQHGEAVMGLAAAALTAGGLTALMPAGILVDRVGAAAAYLVAVALAVAGLVAGALVTQPLFIYAAAFIAGSGTATWRVAMGPLIMQLASPARRARAFSWNVALLVGSGAVWIAASGALPAWLERVAALDEVNAVRGGLVLGALGTALSLAMFLGAVQRRPAAPTVAPLSGRPAASPRVFVRGLRLPADLAALVALVALWMTAAGLVIPFFNIYFLKEHGLPVGRIGLVFALAQTLTAVVIFGSGEIASRLGARRTLAAWMLLFGPMLWALAGVSALELAVFLYVIQGLVPPATNPLIDQILLERAATDRRGAVSSWRNGATDLSGLLGASVGGFMLERVSFDGLFGLAGGLGLLGALSLIVALGRLSKH